MSQVQLLNGMLRRNLKSFIVRVFVQLNPGREFITNFHIDAIAFELEQILCGEQTRLIINMPPRYMKSQIVTVAYTAYVLGIDPTRRVIGISYSLELSAKHMADVRTVMESSWYKRLFPGTRILRATETKIETTRFGYRIASSVGASLTGLGADCIILDDIQKPGDARHETSRDGLGYWVSNTLMSRLEDKARASMVLVMQRVHLNDITAFLLEKQPGVWKHLSLPAIADEDIRIQTGPKSSYGRKKGYALHPKYESLDTLDFIRSGMEEWDFLAQYLQQPVAIGGAMIKRDSIRFIDKLPARDWKVKVVQSWDTAGKIGPQNDFSVCTTWFFIGDDRYLVDIDRGRYEFIELEKRAIELANRWKPRTVLVEDASSGIQLAQSLKRLARFNVDAVNVGRQSKEERVYLQRARFDGGKVHFLKGIPHLDIAIRELTTFPQGKNDDIVDSIVQALAFETFGYDKTMRWVTG